MRLFVWISVAAWALVLAVTTTAQDADKAERIMNDSCQSCHDLRRIQVQAMDAQGWTKTVNTMIEKGAKVAKDDVPVLVSYLVENHGPLPDGPGRSIVLNTCTQCHDLKRIRLGRRSPEEWEETLYSMLNEGAQLSDEDFATVHAYLSRYFGL
jgi:mono/diheme cytochrome c family protein